MLVRIVAFSVLYALVYFVPNCVPLYIGALIDHASMSASQAGWTVSLYLGAMALGAAATTLFLSVMTPRCWSLISLLIQVIGYILPARSNHPNVLLWTMGISGFGNGALFAAANAAAARSAHAALIYGTGVIFSCAAAAALPGVFHSELRAYGAWGMFVVPLAMTPVALLASPVLSEQAGSFKTKIVPVTELLSVRVRFNRAALAVLLVILLTGTFQMAYFSFVDRLLARLQVADSTIAHVFSTIYVAAAAGGALACLLDRTSGSALTWLKVITTLLTASIIVAIVAQTQPVAVSSVYIEAGLAMLIISAQLSVAAELDSMGGVASAASGMLFVSWTLGPVLGGWLLDRFGFSGIATVTSVLGLLSLGLLRFSIPVGATASLARSSK